MDSMLTQFKGASWLRERRFTRRQSIMGKGSIDSCFSKFPKSMLSPIKLTDEKLRFNLANCSVLLSKRPSITDNATQESYPLAYSIVVHRNSSEVARLVRAIYRPYHLFCIHVDLKANDVFRDLSQYAQCFENIMLVPDRLNVTYGGFNRLDADLKCMRLLLQAGHDWRHLINLCGQDFPINSNARIESFTRNLKLTESAIQSVELPSSHDKYRRVNRRQWAINEAPDGFGGCVDNDGAMFDKEKKWFYAKDGTYLNESPFPKMYFGSAYNIFSRQFLAWSFVNKEAAAFLNWSKVTYSPDEHYWATLIRCRNGRT
jgi:hypothetical protein